RRLRSRAARGAALLRGRGAGWLRGLLGLGRFPRRLLLRCRRLRRLIRRRLLLRILFLLGIWRLCWLQRALAGIDRCALGLRIWRLRLSLWLLLSGVRGGLWLGRRRLWSALRWLRRSIRGGGGL